MRAFVTFLCVSSIFATFVAVDCLIVLLTDQEYAEASRNKRISVCTGLGIALSTFLLTVRPWFRNTCRFLICLIGLISSIVVTMLYCQDPASFLAAVIIYFAFGYILIIRDMLFEYLGLVSRHLTQKELKARLQCTKENLLGKENDFKNKSVPCGLKMKRFYRFFCAKKIPKSQLKSVYAIKSIQN